MWHLNILGLLAGSNFWQVHSDGDRVVIVVCSKAPSCVVVLLTLVFCVSCRVVLITC